MSSNYQVLQIAPTIAYKMTDNLYLGFAPLVLVALILGRSELTAPAPLAAEVL